MYLLHTCIFNDRGIRTVFFFASDSQKRKTDLRIFTTCAFINWRLRLSDAISQVMYYVWLQNAFVNSCIQLTLYSSIKPVNQVKHIEQIKQLSFSLNFVQFTLIQRQKPNICVKKCICWQLLINEIVNDKNINYYVWKYDFKQDSNHRPSMLKRNVFLHSTHFTTAALPLSLANSSLYNVNPVNC